MQLTTILLDRYFDSENARIIDEETVLVVSKETGLIHAMQHTANAPKPDIDLRGYTVLPGLVDTHVHLFLHAYNESSWEDQLTKEPLVERTVRAVNHARRTLLAGFTTVRDLGTEGAGDADTALRDCIAKSLTIGPRYFISNKALVASGSYGPRSLLHPSTEGIDNVYGAQAVDGIDECVKAVRQQIGAGADWIKVYADYPVRTRMSLVSRQSAAESISLFNEEELKAIISTSHDRGVKVAAHCNNNESIKLVASLGADSVEHGMSMDDETLSILRDSKVTWNPTLAAYFSSTYRDRWPQAKKTYERAIQMTGLKIACGGDTGVFNHGENALELKLMSRSGTPWNQILQAATLGGWQCVRSLKWEGELGQKRLRRVHVLGEDRRLVGENEMPFGVLRQGFAADLIATPYNIQEDFESAISSAGIDFVMKGGVTYKSGGAPINI